jgi:hypothetical protein
MGREQAFDMHHSIARRKSMAQRHPLRTFIVFALCTLLFSQIAATQTLGRAERFSAAAIDMNTGRTGRIDISVNRWSTPDERATLLNTLFKKEQDAVLDVLRHMRPVGRLTAPGSIGYDLRYAEQRRAPDGGRIVILATDRPMSFWEVVNQPRSADYPFTWIQLNMRADGGGEGSLAVAAKITGEEADSLIEVENYTLQPVRLQNVTSEVKK